MAKSRSLYVCNQCGTESSQYYGRCPACKEWNSLLEQVVAATPTGNRAASLTTSRKPHAAKAQQTAPIAALTLQQIADYPQSRLSSGYTELDRVLGGGIVPGSLVLIGGDPGIGKSTLLLQAANRLAMRYRMLYVCAEESGQQVKLRSQRLGIGRVAADEEIETAEYDSSSAVEAVSNNLYLLPETDLESILRELESLRPQVAVIDSIQALYFASLNSSPGSVAQVRECTSALMQVAKRENISLFIVGHVTKEGAIAGPKVLEHLVDTVLYFEGDRFASHRLLRAVKNRFGATNELGVFEMVDRGLEEVRNPSELFLGNREEQSPGTATIVACEGTRPLVVELQALVSPTSYPSPRRSTTGIEYNRLLQILAVLEKRVGIPLSKLDAYVASSGGLNVGEPAADLGIAVAVAASFRDRTVDLGTVLIGEVGLGGQVRPVSQMELRLKEAAKLGFKRAIVPTGQIPSGVGLEIIPVSRVVDAITIALGGGKASASESDAEN
ncbi:MAG: DNA repair protein RadA [Drouetiella hepatica Uher 2000/2452]|jgi:DNA repair protein RadA/Sms|uniref:DNA repair protein RadA n=1 Tax=Drouetiella hepatica Uher 2000/2452 TaxID=904376 RepID=A0A951UNT6_9CYAN|nr:DNA repair protein RadA [Drouetiella hepatica Uher 2000/2452]